VILRTKDFVPTGDEIRQVGPGPQIKKREKDGG